MELSFLGLTARRGVVLIVCALCAGATLADVPAFMQKPSPQHIRIMCYNVNWDSIFENGDPDNHDWRAYDMSDQFVRVVTAIDPDIVCLQEINSDRNPQDVADILDAALPLGGGEMWRAHSGTDNVIAARFDLSMLATDTIPTTNRDQAMALVDLPDGTYSTDLYLMNAHFKAGGTSSDISRRQQHADAIIHWIGDIKTAGGYINLPADTPIVVLGDLNVYDTDPAHHLTTLITGDIVNQGTYGSDVAPDWDDTDNTDALPLHNAVGPDFYTWRADSGSYNPGALDRIIYTDSAASVDHGFVLNTTTMSSGDLAAAGLQANDVVIDPGSGYFDHLPLVVDLLPPGAQQEYTLTINIIGNGSVTQVPDQATYTYGQDVDLTANAAMGWTFDHWSGDLGGSANPETITMDGDKTVTAYFTQDQYTLTVNIVGNGSVTQVPDQATYTYGQDVDLTANAGMGWTFDHWSGDLGGSANDETITMVGNKTVTAVFLVLDIAGDLDTDGDVDFADYAIFTDCMAGPDVTTPPTGCDPADFAEADMDSDGDVDIDDLSLFQVAFTGDGWG